MGQSEAGGPLPRKHPRTRADEDGIDRGAVLQRLPRRPRHQAQRGPGLASNHANIANTCGKCHFGIEKTYNASVHGQLLAKGDKRGPVCTDCHTAHDIEKPPTAQFKGGERPELRQVSRGPARALPGYLPRQGDGAGPAEFAPEVAACYDCHGHHDVFPVSDPPSHLSKANIVATCQQCHPGADAKFTEYRAARRPARQGQLSGPATGFRLHDGAADRRVCFLRRCTPLFWLFRSIYLYLTDSKTFREAIIIARRTTRMWSTTASTSHCTEATRSLSWVPMGRGSQRF